MMQSLYLEERFEKRRFRGTFSWIGVNDGLNRTRKLSCQIYAVGLDEALDHFPNFSTPKAVATYQQCNTYIKMK